MIRIGVLCPSNIAFRRFLPALKKHGGFAYIGVACAGVAEWAGGSATPEVLEQERRKAEDFRKAYGGEVFEGYAALLDRDDIDAVYLPLPPALHVSWAKKALARGKHVFLEKPAATSARDATELIALAKAARLALHENYMFVYHRQIAEIQRLIAAGELGELRLIRASFGFPFRGAKDFRYNKALGGGALLDCGGYPIRLARLLLGETAELVDGHLFQSRDFGVDLYGNATLRNASGLTAQLAFGMDNAYQCRLEVWGSKGTLTADRIFTPPADLAPKLTIQNNDGTRVIDIEPDDQFCNSLSVFERCVNDAAAREARYADILGQAQAVDALKRRGERL